MYILAIDLETTGLEVGYNEITEIAAQLLDETAFPIVDGYFQSYINILYPERAIRENFNALEYSGITREQLSKSLPLLEVLNLLTKDVTDCIGKDYLKSVSIFSQNTHFDVGFLRKAYQSCGLEFPFDYHTLDLPTIYSIWHLQTNDDWPKKLGQHDMARVLDIPENEKPHSAVHDMTQSVMILQRLMCELKGL